MTGTGKQLEQSSSKQFDHFGRRIQNMETKNDGEYLETQDNNFQKPYYDTIGTTGNNGPLNGGFSVKRTTSYDNFNSIKDYTSNRTKNDSNKKGTIQIVHSSICLGRFCKTVRTARFDCILLVKNIIFRNISNTK